MKVRIFLAANTWYDLSAHHAVVGTKYLVRPDGVQRGGHPIQIALKAASAPTVAGTIVNPDDSAEINMGQNTLKPWVRTTATAGTYIELDGRGPSIVLVEPTTAVA